MGLPYSKGQPNGNMDPGRLQQIQDLYHSAREREPGERNAFLMEACRSDEELQREVESLLAQNGPVTVPCSGRRSVCWQRRWSRRCPLATCWDRIRSNRFWVRAAWV